MPLNRKSVIQHSTPNKTTVLRTEKLFCSSRKCIRKKERNSNNGDILSNCEISFGSNLTKGFWLDSRPGNVSFF